MAWTKLRAYTNIAELIRRVYGTDVSEQELASVQRQAQTIPYKFRDMVRLEAATQVANMERDTESAKQIVKAIFGQECIYVMASIVALLRANGEASTLLQLYEIACTKGTRTRATTELRNLLSRELSRETSGQERDQLFGRLSEATEKARYVSGEFNLLPSHSPNLHEHDLLIQKEEFLWQEFVGLLPECAAFQRTVARIVFLQKALSQREGQLETIRRHIAQIRAAARTGSYEAILLIQNEMTKARKSYRQLIQKQENNRRRLGLYERSARQFRERLGVLRELEIVASKIEPAQEETSMLDLLRNEQPNLDRSLVLTGLARNLRDQAMELRIKYPQKAQAHVARAMRRDQEALTIREEQYRAHGT